MRDPRYDASAAPTELHDPRPAPGPNQSSAPPVDNFAYTFENYADVTDKLAKERGLKTYAIYCGPDVGTYVEFRLVVRHPECVTALVIQNAEAYAESRNKEFCTRISSWRT
jgi:pimeloyl-ACP methyl ester carboxylesterase